MNYQITKIETKLNRPKIAEKEIVWFNPSFSKNVSINVGKYFLLLIQKHFSSNHKYHQIFNKNNVEISYSYTPNIKPVINIRNKEVIAKMKTQEINSNYINKPQCDFPANAKLRA